MFKLEIISRLLNQQRSFTPLHRHEPKESLHGCFKQWRKFNERQGITNLPCDLKAGVTKGWTLDKIAYTLQKTLLGLDFATIMLILLVRCVFYNKSQLG
jgi:hypothetical protein